MDHPSKCPSLSEALTSALPTLCCHRCFLSKIKSCKGKSGTFCRLQCEKWKFDDQSQDIINGDNYYQQIVTSPSCSKCSDRSSLGGDGQGGIRAGAHPGGGGMSQVEEQFSSTSALFICVFRIVNKVIAFSTMFDPLQGKKVVVFFTFLHLHILDGHLLRSYCAGSCFPLL